MAKITRFVGMDVHSETIAVAVAEGREGAARSLGTIANRPEAVRRLLGKLGDPAKLKVCYEAGPTGYALYWQLTRLGIHCDVIAPSLVPVKAGERIKTDRRDAEKLARSYRSGDLTPVFVANTEPPTIDFDSLDEKVSQHSNGLGSLSGASLGAGFWLDGEAFSGTVLRAIFTNYGYTFKASDGAGTFDRVNRTERRFMGFFGSYMRWSFFTIGGGLGLGYELNQQERCELNAVPTSDGTRIAPDPDADCDGELQLAADRNAVRAFDVNGFLHPVYLEGRLSLGFIID